MMMLFCKCGTILNYVKRLNDKLICPKCSQEYKIKR